MSGERGLHELTVHQLLGRIVYFHVLLIAPEPPSAGRTPMPGPACCRHQARGSRSRAAVLESSAWGALIEIAAELPDGHRPCPHTSDECCATCRVTSASMAVGRSWATAEYRAYYQNEPGSQLVRDCGRAVAYRLGRVFAAQHPASCTAPDRLAAEPPASERLPGVEELPLTGELLILWTEPDATAQSPVASWLNHCTGGLGDVRRVLESRRTPS
ncbi:hypothetical protein [Streptomyces sp. NPDC058486]|uniref:hypothetical protein n=1 Tax=unclassified Streptomyces TaxID=2593676 RepID=UPI00364B6495